MKKPLVLCSSSPARLSLLKRLNLPFKQCVPDIDETALSGESPVELVERLALEKARACIKNFPKHLLIGSDTTVVCRGEMLGKPGTHKNAVAQLKQMSTEHVSVVSSLCLYDSEADTYQLGHTNTDVKMRALTDEIIEHYLKADQPYGCAGSIQIEKLGISLTESVSSDDPSAIIGLPLILLCNFLGEDYVY